VQNPVQRGVIHLAWFAVARTSRPETPDALQGFHASDIRVSDDGRSIIETLNDTTRGQIMFVIDEAAGVSDRVFEVAEGALASPNSSLLMGGNPTRGTSESSPQTKVPLHEASAPSPAINSPADRPPSPGARARSAALVEQHNWINFLDAAAKAEERAWLDYMRRLFSDATAKIDAVEQSQ